MSKAIATVNGKPVSQADYLNAIQGYAMEMHRKTMDHLSAEELKEIEDLALEKLLARELVFQEALGRGLVADEEAIEREKGKITANFASEEEFYATLEKANIDQAAYHRMIRQDLTVNMMTDAKLGEVAEPGAEEVEAVYRDHPEKMKSPAQVRACHILIKADPSKKEEALERIEEIRKKTAEEKFSVLAKLHSDCPSAAKGGDLGYFARGGMVKPFEDAAFSQEVGEVGPVVETPFGFHLIQVLDRQDEATLSFEEAEPKIRRFLKDEAGARHLEEWVAGLKAAAKIEMVKN